MEEPNDDIVRDKISLNEATDKFKSNDANDDDSGMTDCYDLLLSNFRKFFY